MKTTITIPEGWLVIGDLDEGVFSSRRWNTDILDALVKEKNIEREQLKQDIVFASMREIRELVKNCRFVLGEPELPVQLIDRKSKS